VAALCTPCACPRFQAWLTIHLWLGAVSSVPARRNIAFSILSASWGFASSICTYLFANFLVPRSWRRRTQPSIFARNGCNPSFPRNTGVATHLVHRTNGCVPRNDCGAFTESHRAQDSRSRWFGQSILRRGSGCACLATTAPTHGCRERRPAHSLSHGPMARACPAVPHVLR